MQFKILDIQEDDNGHLHVDYQCACGPDGDVTNRKVGPFDGDDPWEDFRLWLALNAESVERKRPAQPPADIADLVGKPVDTSELRQRFKPQLDQFRDRAEQAQRDAEEEQREREERAQEQAEWERGELAQERINASRTN